MSHNGKVRMYLRNSENVYPRSVFHGKEDWLNEISKLKLQKHFDTLESNSLLCVNYLLYTIPLEYKIT